MADAVRAKRQRALSLYPGLRGKHPRADKLASILHNQVKHFNRLREDASPEADLIKNQDEFVLALAKAWGNSDLFDMVSIQPMDTPVDLVFSYKVPKKTPLQAFVEGVYGGMSVRLESYEVRGIPRRSRAHLDLGDDLHVCNQYRAQLDNPTYKLLEGVLGEIRSEILNNLWAGASYEGTTTVESLIGNLKSAAERVAGGSTVGPANCVVADREVGRLIKQHTDFRVFEPDFGFPLDDVVFWRNTPDDEFDSSYIYAPLSISTTSRYLDPSAFTSRVGLMTRASHMFRGGAGKLKLVIEI